MSNIVLKSIYELLDYNFYIPEYQRGYRWDKEQVWDLLSDIEDFSLKGNKKQGEFYCLQPLVVKKIDDTTKNLHDLDFDKDWYEVIDGQQRLTTIYIILKEFKSSIESNDLPVKKFRLKYQRDSKFCDFLEKIDNDNFDYSSIDRFYASNSFKTIKEFRKYDRKNANFNAGKFVNALLSFNNNGGKDLENNVRFIWYEPDDNENPVEIFRRLNEGKIELTDAELIKALFLNKSNFSTCQDVEINLRQREISSEWDSIENDLHNDLFWGFIGNNKYDKVPTRISYILDMICNNNILKIIGNETDSIGSDKHKTFRYFYAYFKEIEKNDKKKQDLDEAWKKVKNIFSIFQEWFNDIELYHYIGFVNNSKNNSNIKSIIDLLNDWSESSDKKEFIFSLKDLIKRSVFNKKGNLKEFLEEQKYDMHKCPPKTNCLPILLLHNILTIINQFKLSIEKYGSYDFYRFPFTIFKLENWNVEHIDSNTENLIEDEKSQKVWLQYALLSDEVDENLKLEIKNFLKSSDVKKSNEVTVKFEDLKNKIDKVLDKDKDNRLSDEDKQKIWNFCLLDENTNKGYGNSVFHIKRKIIIGKDRGIRYCFDNNEWKEIEYESSFIPICTKYVFLKYYNQNSAKNMYWDKDDADSYKRDMLDKFTKF